MNPVAGRDVSPQPGVAPKSPDTPVLGPSPPPLAPARTVGPARADRVGTPGVAATSQQVGHSQDVGFSVQSLARKVTLAVLSALTSISPAKPVDLGARLCRRRLRSGAPQLNGGCPPAGVSCWLPEL